MPSVADPAGTPAPRPIRQAATLIVLRDGSEGLEALLLRRAEKANDQNSGASVFPGGLLDAHDRQLHGCCAGMDDARASARLSIAAGGLDYYAAAVRECFEEAGLLLAQDAQGRLVDLDALGDAQLAALRGAAAAGTDALLAMCRARGWQLATQQLAYFAHWLTPPGMPRRFDTRFFVAALPPGQRVDVDRVEIAEHAWLRPAQAIDPARGLKLMNVTRRILQQLAQFGSVDDCMAHAHALREVPLTMPRLAGGPGGARAVNMEEPAYAEVGFVDPEGRGHARHTLEGALVLQMAARVWRVTARDAAATPHMAGAHSYFVGIGPDAWVLIDPLPGDTEHLERLRAAAPGPVCRIVRSSPPGQAWHAHEAARLGALWPDAQLEPVQPGDTWPAGTDASLHALAAAGEPRDLAFLLQPEGILFGAMPAAPGAGARWLAPARGFMRPVSPA